MDNRNSPSGGTGAGRGPGADAGQPTLAEKRAGAKPYAVWLYIWGGEWLVSAALLFFDPANAFAVWRQAVLLAAVAASAFAGFAALRRSIPAGKTSEPRIAISAAVWPVLAGALIVAFLLQAGAIPRLYMPLLMGIVPAVAYGALSFMLGRPLLYMSLWLLALTVTVAYAYLGYAPVLLGGFGGLSMLALGLMLNMWHTLWKRRMG